MTTCGAGHGGLLADCCRYASTRCGDMCSLFELSGVKSPNCEMMSAATPAALGVAIEVPLAKT